MLCADPILQFVSVGLPPGNYLLYSLCSVCTQGTIIKYPDKVQKASRSNITRHPLIVDWFFLFHFHLLFFWCDLNQQPTQSSPECLAAHNNPKPWTHQRIPRTTHSFMWVYITQWHSLYLRIIWASALMIFLMLGLFQRSVQDDKRRPRKQR